MPPFRTVKGPDGHARVQLSLRGGRLISHPLFNKGTSFTREEREIFALDGLLPDAVSTLELQAKRMYGSIARKTDPLEKYIGLAALQDRNETLFFRLLLEFVFLQHNFCTPDCLECNWVLNIVLF